MNDVQYERFWQRIESLACNLLVVITCVVLYLVIYAIVIFTK